MGRPGVTGQGVVLEARPVPEVCADPRQPAADADVDAVVGVVEEGAVVDEGLAVARDVQAVPEVELARHVVQERIGRLDGDAALARVARVAQRQADQRAALVVGADGQPVPVAGAGGLQVRVEEHAEHVPLDQQGAVRVLADAHLGGGIEVDVRPILDGDDRPPRTLDDHVADDAVLDRRSPGLGSGDRAAVLLDAARRQRGVEGLVRVVAVAAHDDVVGRRRAADARDVIVAVAVAVQIGVPHGGVFLVGGRIAVVVDAAVAQLGGARVV